MKVTPLPLPGPAIIEPDVHTDARGALVELWSQERFAGADRPAPMRQVNLVRSGRGVLRGLHLQHPRPQAKLVSAADGAVFDVAVDVRLGSPGFGRWAGATLSRENGRQLWIPEGFAHGFCVIGDGATVIYTLSAEYSPDAEIAIAWNDPALAIDWPVAMPRLSDKDAAAPRLADIDPARLPRWREAGA